MIFSLLSVRNEDYNSRDNKITFFENNKIQEIMNNSELDEIIGIHKAQGNIQATSNGSVKMVSYPGKFIKFPKLSKVKILSHLYV